MAKEAITHEDLFEKEEELPNNFLAIEETIPLPTSPEWNDYVLSQFLDEEKFNGSPTVDGLRRVAILLVGEILENRTEVLQVPTKDNDNRATVKCTIRFNRVDLNGVSLQTSFDGVADVCWQNCDKPFYKYPTSIAETRAEGRALKKALGLRKIVAAEELSNVAMQDNKEEADTIEKITDNQINFIEILCRNDARGLNIDVQKFVAKNYTGVYNIRELTHSQSLSLQKILSEFQQDKTTIPNDVLNYQSEWRKTFA